MMARDPKYYTSIVICNTCGTKQPITRRYKRAEGHLKHTWCRVCKERTAHTEQEEGALIDNTGEQFQEEGGNVCG